MHFGYHLDSKGQEDPYIELHLQKGTLIRRLRFRQPRDLEIEKGFPNRTHGLCILDVSARQLEGVGIRIEDFENTPGAIRFWARDVVDLDAAKGDEPAKKAQRR